MFEDGVEIIYVEPHKQPIFIPDDDDDDGEDSLFCLSSSDEESKLA